MRQGDRESYATCHTINSPLGANKTLSIQKFKRDQPLISLSGAFFQFSGLSAPEPLSSSPPFQTLISPPVSRRFLTVSSSFHLIQTATHRCIVTYHSLIQLSSGFVVHVIIDWLSVFIYRFAVPAASGAFIFLLTCTL